VIVLSCYQARTLLDALEKGELETAVSLDLNLTIEAVALDASGVHLPGDYLLGWEDVRRIVEAENACFELADTGIREIRVFSETTNWVRSLYPTSKAPSMLVSGMIMHRIEGIDPHQDTLNKIKAASPVVGRVLDTATGLGYTAIEAAKTAEHVDTVEIDPASLEIARRNPWSQDLFDNPKITTHIDHAWDFVEEIDAETYSLVIHDPPTFKFAGELYSGDFYRELYRVLRRKGRLFHYIGDPESKAIQRVQRGVMKRLQEVGFQRVERKPRAFGVVASK
jgi:predicted methyltransferase